MNRELKPTVYRIRCYPYYCWEVALGVSRSQHYGTWREALAEALRMRTGVL